jgi:hypothetical protein
MNLAMARMRQFFFEDMLHYVVLVSACLGGFLASWFLCVSYYSFYHIPFGMVDVDRYVAWISGSKELDVTHYAIIHLLWLIPNSVEFLNLMLPFMAWIILPFSLFMLYSVWGGQKSASYATLLFMFGTFTALFFQVCALWAQMLSFILFLWFLRYYSLMLEKNQAKHVISAAVFLVLSIVAHPYTILLFFLLLLSEVYRRSITLGLSLTVICAILALGLGLFSLLTPFSNHDGVEPNLYMMFFVYMNPILLIFPFFGLYRRPRLLSFFLILCVVAPFISLGRAMPYLFVFFVFYAYQGFKFLRWRCNHKDLFEAVVLLSVIAYFNYFFGFILNNMLEQMPLRDLDPIWLKMLLRFKG